VRASLEARKGIESTNAPMDLNLPLRCVHLQDLSAAIPSLFGEVEPKLSSTAFQKHLILADRKRLNQALAS
jgi:hypothetical protein